MKSNNDLELKPEVDETTDQNVPTGEENESLETLDETPEQELGGDQQNNSEEEEASEEEDLVDYKAELEKAREVAESYKKGMLKANAKLKKRRDDDSDDEYGEVQGEDLIETITARVRDELSSFKSDLSSNLIEEELSRLTSNDDEKALILHYYNTRITQRGNTKKDIHEDLLDCKVLANKQKLLNRDAELKHVLTTKHSTQTKPNFSSKPPKKAQPSNVPPELQKFVQAMDKHLKK